MKNFICVTLAVLLLAASVAVLYPGLIGKVADESTATLVTDKLRELMDGSEVPADSDVLEVLGLENFPLYGNSERYGLYDFCREFIPYINEETETLPDVGAALGKLISGENVLDTLYYFVIIALLSIPVYMLLRLVPFNALYEAADECFVLARPFARGLAASACAVVSISATWFLYNTLIYEKLYMLLVEWLKSRSKPDIALTLTNIVLIAVAVVVVVALLKSTLFRGSIVKSILLAVLRALLFVGVFAAINAFIGCATLRVLIFALALLLIVGVLDTVLDPPKAKAA